MSNSVDEVLERYLRTLNIDLDGAKANLHEWDVRIAKRADADVAICVSKGTELHFVSLAEGKAMSRRNMLEALEPILKEHGYVTTRVPIEENNHKLRIKLGFMNTWSDDSFSYWALTELPYQKKEK